MAAARRAEKSQWAIGDALLEEVGRGESVSKFEACATELAEEGLPYAPSTLRRLRDLAAKFPVGVRPPTLGIEMAAQAGTPSVLAKAEKMAAEENRPVTKRFVGQVRKSVHARPSAAWRTSASGSPAEGRVHAGSVE
jgi:hypothetical protein